MNRILSIVFFTALLIEINAQICIGNYVLESQADINDFNQTCSVVDGSLTIGIIGDNTDIVDLTPLSNITYIKGKLNLYSNTINPDFGGLPNLDSIRSGLSIRQNTEIINLSGLSNLKSINGQLFISGNKLLENLDGLSNLEYIRSGIWINRNDNLTNIDGLQNVTSQAGAIINGNQSLLNVDGLLNIEYMNGGLSIIDNDRLEDLNGLSNLKEVAFDFVIDGNMNLTDLSGLSNLFHLGTLAIINSNLANIDGLSKLQNIGSIGIRNNQNLKNLDGLVNVNSSVKTLYIGSNPLLENINGLQNIPYTEGRIDIVDNALLKNLDGLTGIDTILGPFGITIGVNPSLLNVDGLSNLSCIPGDLYLHSNESIGNLSGLSNIKMVEGDLILSDLGVENLSSLENLESVGGLLSIGSCPNLLNLNGLENIDSIGNGILVQVNATLRNIDIFSNLSFFSGNITIINNPALSNCCGIYQLLNNPNIDNITISNNPSICSNSLEIVDNCISGINANFDFDAFCMEGPVQFVDLSISSGAITLWQWNFGDGGNSDQQNPQYTYSTPGNYTVELIVCVDSNCDSLEQNVVVTESVETSLLDSICEGAIFQIDNNYYSVSGNYNDTLQSISGCDSIVNLNLTVIPTESITPSAPILNATSSQSISVFWEQYCSTVTNYWLYRSETIDGYYSPVYIGNQLQYENSDDGILDVIPNSTYYFKIRHETSGGLTLFSDISQITTPTISQNNLADLKPIAIILDNDVWENDALEVIDVHIANIGEVEAEASRAIISLVNNLSGEKVSRALFEEIIEFPTISVDGSFSISHSFYVPNLLPGEYILEMEIDVLNEVVESNSDNNYILANRTIRVPNPIPSILADISCKIINTSAEIAKIGESFKVLIQIENNGLESINTLFKNRIYLSKDHFITSSDIPITAEFFLGNLPSGETLIEDIDITIPNLNVGEYFLGIISDTDNSVVEEYESNNMDFLHPPIEIISDGSIIISGQVYSANGSLDAIDGFGNPFDLLKIPVEGVVMNGLPGYVVTDENGEFEASVPANWDGVITPIHSDLDIFSGDMDSRGQNEIVINNIVENKQLLFIGFSVEDFARLIVKELKLTEVLQTELKTYISSDVLGFAEKAFTTMSIANAAYQIANRPDEDVKKYFDLIVLLAPQSPISPVLGAYIYIAKEIIDDIGNLSELLLDNAFDQCVQDIRFSMRVVHENAGFLNSDYSIPADLYSEFLKANLLLFKRDDQGNILNDPIYQSRLDIKPPVDNIILCDNEPCYLIMETSLSGFFEDCLSIPNEQKVFIIQLIWNDHEPAFRHEILLPLSDILANNEIFTGAGQVNFTFQTQSGLNVSPNDILLGAPFIKIKK